MTPQEYIDHELKSTNLRLRHAKERGDEKAIYALWERIGALKLMDEWCREKEEKDGL